MSAQPVRRKDETTSTATVIPIRSFTQNAGSADLDLGSQWFPQIGDVQEDLRMAVEAYVIDAYYKHVFSRPPVTDNPFDEIYISQLQPDAIWKADVTELEKYAEIVDLSDELGFNDGLDD